MAREIQTTIKAVDTKEKARRILHALKWYVNTYAELEKEYSSIPNWRFFKQMRNLKKRERLTREFKTRMFELGVFV
jgi:hypothetical protein